MRDAKSSDAIVFAKDCSGLAFDGERYIPSVTGPIRIEHLHRYLFAAQFSSNRDVLDIACGEGYGTAALGVRARSVRGVDIADDVVSHAKQRYGAGNRTFSVGSITEIPARDASFDLVVCFETIEHVADHQRALEEIHRVLRPEGLLIISTPNVVADDGAKHAANPFHLRELMEGEFRNLLHLRFENVELSEQRFLHGSVLAPLMPPAHLETELHESSDGSHYFRRVGDLGKFYFVALASNAPLPSMPLSIMDAKVDLAFWEDEFRFAVAELHRQNSELEHLRTQLALSKIQLEAARKKLSVLPPS